MGKADPGFKRDKIMVIPLNNMNETLVSQKLINTTGSKDQWVQHRQICQTF
jgi:hypothetical protein